MPGFDFYSTEYTRGDKIIPTFTTHLILGRLLTRPLISSAHFKPIDLPNPPSEHCGDSEDMESSSTTTKKSSSSASAPGKQPSASKVPPEAEIEEFFSAAEKREQKRFAEKYNYDIVKDAPLEGRYQWVSLKP
uniref:Putative ovule protein n=1 Tax=Solanum chacoense TaxID=4108 RepID=A0A0V0GRD6_SOLCH